MVILTSVPSWLTSQLKPPFRNDLSHIWKLPAVALARNDQKHAKCSFLNGNFNWPSNYAVRRPSQHPRTKMRTKTTLQGCDSGVGRRRRRTKITKPVLEACTFALKQIKSSFHSDFDLGSIVVDQPIEVTIQK